ncbi:propanediol utilization protein [Fuscibacter oryzae]|uniref:Propanediol utilization protein n=1 Tax=Fuscibacter oryzae TaxID=2803939 RepID=A0A8J7MU15_9RHOB|nr:propanediol utilization protein [Fuscibacter oryzae]MBL4929005.1 propanediol utilization protein [Fuscibacter oryzae]
MRQKSAVTSGEAPGFARVTGHFGELLQGRLGPNGPVALVTLPCPVLSATAQLVPGVPGLHQPDGRVLAWPQARRFLRMLGVDGAARAVLRVNMPPGGGAGASTAGLVALARAFGAAEGQIAAACLAAEGASDPLMLPDPGGVLWASRRGQVVQRFFALPRLEVLGGFCGTPQRTDPSDSNFPDIGALVQDWRAASGDLPRLAALASQSARMTLALRGPVNDGTEAMANRLGALGFSIAHTGSARALLFAPGTVPPGAESLLREAGWRQVMRFRTGGRDA